MFSGELILPHDRGYEQARGVFNAMIDKRPAVIARCVSTADVAACVRTADEAGLQVAVRCGGHSVAGLGVCEGGILIDPFIRLGRSCSRGSRCGRSTVRRTSSVAMLDPTAPRGYRSYRRGEYLFHPITTWSDPADDERLIAATRAFADAMRPFGTGAAYLKFTPTTCSG